MPIFSAGRTTEPVLLPAALLAAVPAAAADALPVLAAPPEDDELQAARRTLAPIAAPNARGLNFTLIPFYCDAARRDWKIQVSDIIRILDILSTTTLTTFSLLWYLD